MESNACWLIVFPVVFFTNILIPVVAPDCTSDAVVKPEVAGPINAIGAMKQPDKSTPMTTVKNIFLKIESP